MADFADNAATLNRVFRGSLVAFAALAALVVSPLATATSVERVRVAGPGVTAAFPRAISLELTSPPEYRRGSVSVEHTSGRWLGPEYWASGDTSKRGTSSIRWSVDFQGRGGPAQAVALAGPRHGWPLDKKDPIAVPHVVGKRIVGTILGYYAITRAPVPNDASFEAAIAFPVGPKAFTVARFSSPIPHPTRPVSGATTSSAGSTFRRSGRAVRPSGRYRACGCSATFRRRASPSPTRAER